MFPDMRAFIRSLPMLCIAFSQSQAFMFGWLLVVVGTALALGYPILLTVIGWGVWSAWWLRQWHHRNRAAEALETALLAVENQARMMLASDNPITGLNHMTNLNHALQAAVFMGAQPADVEARLAAAGVDMVNLDDDGLSEDDPHN